MIPTAAASVLIRTGGVCPRDFRGTNLVHDPQAEPEQLYVDPLFVILLPRFSLEQTQPHPPMIVWSTGCKFSTGKFQLCWTKLRFRSQREANVEPLVIGTEAAEVTGI